MSLISMTLAELRLCQNSQQLKQDDRTLPSSFFFFLHSEKVDLGTAHTWQRTDRFSEGSFLIWESVGWTIKKCRLSTITGVCVKWLHLKGYKGFPWGQKKNVRNNMVSVLSGCLCRLNFICLMTAEFPAIHRAHISWLLRHTWQDLQICVTDDALPRTFQ